MEKDRYHLRQALTSEQIKHLLDTVQEFSLKALLTIAITTGLRRGELLRLRWQDIDVQDEVLHVCGKMEPVGTSLTIALPRIALRALEELQRCQEETYTKRGETWHGLGLVFSDEVGQPFNPSKLWQQYHALFVAAGFPQMNFHDLRHCTAAFFFERGVSIAVIQAILRVRRSSTLFKHLTLVSLSMQKEAMKKWDDLLEV